MKTFLAKLMIIVAAVIFVFWSSVIYFTDKTSNADNISPLEHSIRISGLPPKSQQILKYSIQATFLSIMIFFLYSKKLAKSLASKKDFHRFLRWFRLFHNLLLVASVLSILEISFAITSLIPIQNVNSYYLWHSKLFTGCFSLYICISLFLLTDEYHKKLKAASQ